MVCWRGSADVGDRGVFGMPSLVLRAGPADPPKHVGASNIVGIVCPSESIIACHVYPNRSSMADLGFSFLALGFLSGVGGFQSDTTWISSHLSLRL